MINICEVPVLCGGDKKNSINITFSFLVSLSPTSGRQNWGLLNARQEFYHGGTSSDIFTSFLLRPCLAKFSRLT